MNKGTPTEWLDYVADMQPPPEAWSDPNFVQGVSWVLLSFLWRRMNQRLIDAGCVISYDNEANDWQETRFQIRRQPKP